MMPGMPKDTARALVQYAEYSRIEVCGFIMRNWEWFEIENVHPVPGSNFDFEPVGLLHIMMHHRGQAAGVFHSHPHGNPHPSQNDIAAWGYGTGLRYWIIAGGDVYEWEINNDIATPVAFDGSRGSQGLAYPVLAAPEKV